MKRIFISAVTVFLLTGCGSQSIPDQSEPLSKEISRDDALSIALENADVPSDDVFNVKIEQDGDNGIPHKLVIYAVLKDGSQVYYTYDVTEQMHRAPDPLNIHLHLEGLPLPTPVGGDGGMTPDIDGWNDVKIDIEM